MNDKTTKLARVLDPEAWAQHDRSGMEKYPEAQAKIVENSFELAQRVVDSWLMASETWDRAEYLKAIARVKERTSRRGYCYGVEDGLDGYVMHDARCRHWPDSAFSGSDCIKPK